MKRPSATKGRHRLLRFSTLAAVVGLAAVAAHSCTRARPAELDVVTSVPSSQAAAPATKVAEAPLSGARILSAIRDTAVRVVRPHESLGLEGMVNQMDPYLLGMLEMLRLMDGKTLEGLRQALADDTCDNPSRDGLDLALLAKLILIEPKLASPRALNCALERHQSEDFVLWLLLDAHDVAGREPLPALATLRQNAKDERTLRRLSSSREKRLAQASPVAGPRTTRPGTPRGQQ